MTNIDLIANVLEYRPEAWKGENRDIARHINDAGIVFFHASSVILFIILTGISTIT